MALPSRAPRPGGPHLPRGERREVAIVGAGFAGSILARILAVQGRDVVLVERGRHPRFALGESTTPLANLCLERLAARWDLPDLHALAAWGRWNRALPEVGRGLKRGFTFYAHRRGEVYANYRENAARLLVAASPTDEVADSHWKRADVDHHLARAAVAAGVDLREGTAVETVEAIGPVAAPRAWRLAVVGPAGGGTLVVDTVIDATGPGGLLARQLPIASALGRMRTRSGLVFGHFRGLAPFVEVARAAGAEMPPGPYPDEKAAVHHLLEEGWVYVLPFDDGVVSAGLLAVPEAAAELGLGPGGDGAAAWRTLLGRYPTLAAQFAGAEPLFPLGTSARIQHRLARAAGPGWAVLPHAFAFVDPLFSTGIAWSLLGVERLAGAFAEAGYGRRPAPSAWLRYDALLQAEADQVDQLVAGAYLARREFALFAAQAMLYFALVSSQELRQRLAPAPGSAWEGFLGAGDPEAEALVAGALRRLSFATGGGARHAGDGTCRAFASWVAEAIDPWNVIGLADPARENLYPVDLEVLLERGGRLGLSQAELEAALPRLRGGLG